MSLPKISEIQNLSQQELEKEILKVKKQIFQLKMDQKSYRPFKPHIYQHSKHRLSQLLMVKGKGQNIS